MTIAARAAGKLRGRSALVAALCRAVQRRGRSWLTKRVKVLRIEGAERGFDCRAEAGYAVAHTAPEERDPNTGAREDFRRANRGGTAGMKFAVKFRALPGCDLIEIFRLHYPLRTSHSNIPALGMRAERKVR